MLRNELISPKSIAIIGASANKEKPGGKVLTNLLETGYSGELYAVNPNRIEMDGVCHVASIDALPKVDLVILSIPAQQCVDAVRQLITKEIRVFIVFSAGFSEVGDEGERLEKQLVELVNSVNGTLIGPNCIGTIQQTYKGVFTTPIPEYFSDGCELISSSGATAVFIMEAASKTGLKFSNIYSIGNSAQTGIEEILEYLDENYVQGISSPVKLLYLESIKKPFKFLKHTQSLIRKGCKIAAIKAGSSAAGGRAASSHTGALVTSESAVRALFRKAGIVYCSGREELIMVAGIFQNKSLCDNRIAIITHAGGSAVMLTDALATGGFDIPEFPATETQELLSHLNAGSSVSNPIDFLATGTDKHLEKIIEFCENYDRVDAMVVVFGSPGLFNVKKAYEVLDAQIKKCKKPIYPVLPSVVNANNEIKQFLKKGNVNFSDEVVLGNALSAVRNTKKPISSTQYVTPEMDLITIRETIKGAVDGYLDSRKSFELLAAAGIPIAQFFDIENVEALTKIKDKIHFPVVAKVKGPVHKTEVNGVRIGIHTFEQLQLAIEELFSIPDATGVLIQQMVYGEELYIGAIKEGEFGHVVLCGLGGIFLELLSDTSAGLAPLTKKEIEEMVQSLKGYPIISGYRNRECVNEDAYIDSILRIAALVHLAPEIAELDINPIMGNSTGVVAVDVRIRIDK
jgi:acetate---CoA ligase (ADP-forming)